MYLFMTSGQGLIQGLVHRLSGVLLERRETLTMVVMAALLGFRVAGLALRLTGLCPVVLVTCS